jgi:hypothetical protein
VLAHFAARGSTEEIILMVLTLTKIIFTKNDEDAGTPPPLINTSLKVNLTYSTYSRRI